MLERGRFGRSYSIPFGIALLLGACNRHRQPDRAPGASNAATTSRSAAPAAGSAAPSADKDSCGGLGCRLYDTPALALARVLKEKPLVLAVGETHAQRGSGGVESATKRFTDQLLPVFKGRASDLVIELWLGNSHCQKQVKKVAKKQKVVTKHQKKSDQNQFIALGTAAKHLGIQPHALRPSCKEYDRILEAGPDDIAQMLDMIARLTGNDLTTLVKRNEKAGKDAKMVLAYGGAMHNDLYPQKGLEQWSFGKRVDKAAGGRYAALDLIVPEFVKDTKAWRSLPWYRYFHRGQYPGKTRLYHPGKGSWVLVFPASTSARTPADAGQE